MPHSAIFSPNPLLELILDEAAQFKALLQKNRLPQTQCDIRVGIIWFESFVESLVIPFLRDERVFLHGDAQALFAAIHAHDEGARTRGIRTGKRVAMDAHEKIRFDVVGDFDTLSNFWIGVALACHYNFHIGKAFRDVVAQKKGHFQGHCLFSRLEPSGP